jgi:LMBR1 domain-containing protein 1
MRVSFPEYIIALTTIFGSILFVIFGGVGMACLPMSLIATFLRRPKTTISRAQYIKEATHILKRGKDIKEVLLGLQREERAGSKGRKWKKNVLKMQKELIYLEQDDEALTEVFPQGEKADTSWALTVISYLTCLFFGIVG